MIVKLNNIKKKQSISVGKNSHTALKQENKKLALNNRMNLRYVQQTFSKFPVS